MKNKNIVFDFYASIYFRILSYFIHCIAPFQFQIPYLNPTPYHTHTSSSSPFSFSVKIPHAFIYLFIVIIIIL